MRGRVARHMSYVWSGYKEFYLGNWLPRDLGNIFLMQIKANRAGKSAPYSVFFTLLRSEMGELPSWRYNPIVLPSSG